MSLANRLVTGFLTGGLVLFSFWASVGAERAQKDAKKDPTITTRPNLKSAPGDSDLRKLLIERYNEALGEVVVNYKDVHRGKITPDPVVAAGTRLLKAGLDLYDMSMDKTTFLEELRDLAYWLEKHTDADRTAAMHRARQFRVEVQIHLLHARKQKEK